MKYHYQKGKQSGFRQYAGRSFWTIVLLAILVGAWDALFNNCGWFINLIIWSSERI